jgi:hypothetical protein
VGSALHINIYQILLLHHVGCYQIVVVQHKVLILWLKTFTGNPILAAVFVIGQSDASGGVERHHTDEGIMAFAGVPGAHALRRYRVTWLEEQGCPRGLEAAWIGHSMSDVTSKYDKTAEDREFRRKQVERIGTGLEIDWATKPQI